MRPRYDRHRAVAERAPVIAVERARPMRSAVADTPAPLHARPRAREREREARRRFQSAVAAAVEWLRRAEERFDESAAVIDAHIQRATISV
jgi:hypothetical protein